RYPGYAIELFRLVYSIIPLIYSPVGQLLSATICRSCFSVAQFSCISLCIHDFSIDEPKSTLLLAMHGIMRSW
uniref:Uncharacterized protein n=1 Tax=Aegilops tauschii subsp. strangulata TaxID=200361 RepID=A0A452YBX5_AEGTS